MTRCQCNQYSKHSLLSEGQFQGFHNIMKYVLSQLSLLNLVSWLTPCWFHHSPLFEIFDSYRSLCVHFLHNADRADGLPKTWCGLLHSDCNWMHQKRAEWCAPWVVCGLSMRATRFRMPQRWLVTYETSSNLGNCHRLKFQVNGHWSAFNDHELPSNVRLSVLPYVDPCPVILNEISK